jgi:hypothetical protein
MLRQDRHVCAFFSSAAEEYDTLLPFVCDGINCGHRAYHVLPDHHKEDHFQRLRSVGIDVAKAMKSPQLEVAVPEDTYLRTGRFQKDAMLVLIQDALKAGPELGFPLTRMIAHRSMERDDPVPRAPFRRMDQAVVRDAHGVERAVERSRPVVEEAAQSGELRRQIVVLPDVELKQAGVVRKMIVNLRRRQAVALHPELEVLADHARLLVCRSSPFHASSWLAVTDPMSG